jgi:pre-mRNA-splicing factor CWC26
MNELGHDEILKRKYLARGAGDAATKAYIASKYLSEDGGSKKKKKKKSSSSGMKKGNIGIIDDEDSGWGNETEQDNLKETLKEEENEAFEQAALSNAGATFKGTSNNWQTIREGDRDDQEEEEDEEDKPVVIEQEGQRMSTGQKVGLLKGSALKEEFARAREAEKKTMERLKTESKGEGAETVYRDSSGRKTDPKMKRAEEARKRQEEIEKEARRMEWGKGLVQRQEAEAKRKELEDQKNKPMAR